MTFVAQKRCAITQPQHQSYRLIPLTQGQNAIVDAADFASLSQFSWYALRRENGKTFYAARKQDRQEILMHRVILGCALNEQGDHRNHDTLDNRRDNLRKATSAQNMRNRRKGVNNRSGFKGVYLHWCRSKPKWRAQIRHEGKAIYLGDFQSRVDAARVYDEAAKRIHGDFAKLNFQT